MNYFRTLGYVGMGLEIDKVKKMLKKCLKEKNSLKFENDRTLYISHQIPSQVIFE